MKNSKRGIAALLVLAMLCTMLPGMSLRTSAAELDTQTEATEAAQTEPTVTEAAQTEPTETETAQTEPTETEAAQTKPTETVPSSTEQEETVSETTKETVRETQENTVPKETILEETAPQETAPAKTAAAEETAETLAGEALPEIEADKTVTVQISTAGEYAYFTFTPEYSESYTFYSVSNSDTFGCLYDVDMNELASNDDGGEGANFSLTYTLTAGQTYIWGARYYDINGMTGSFDVILRTNHDDSNAVFSSDSCLEAGTKTYTCSICNQEITEVVPAGHIIVDGVCARCGQKICGDGLTWDFDKTTGTLTISGTGDMSDFTVNSSPWYAYRSSILHVVIENGVTSIGVSAFEHCGNLISVVIPESVTSIGQFAFLGCSRLINLVIPNGVTSIGSQAFSTCLSLTDVTIPGSVISIGSYAFEYCSSLQNITIMDGVTDISYGAFRSCSSLTSVTIPDSVTSIANEAFESCESLDGIWVSSENQNYSNDTYGVLFDKAYTTLIQAPGSLSGTYEIPNGVSSICHDAFAGCKYLTGVVIPNSVTSIEWGAFSTCSSLMSISIPNSVTSIESSCFSGCSSLTDVFIPNSVTSIGEWAFYECSSLSNITIPEELITIDDGAFNGCSSLTDFTIPSSVTFIGYGVFANCDSLRGIWVSDENQYYSNDAYGVLFNKDCSTLLLAPGSLSGAYEIPNGVVTIDDDAFRGCKNLTYITMPESVAKIGDYVFTDDDSLGYIRFKGDLCTINNYAFYYIRATVYYPAGNATWTSDVMQNYGGMLTWEEYSFKIAQQPEDCAVRSGKNATFSVLASSPEATYQWYQSSDGETWQICDGECGSSLTVAVTAENNGWQYHCVVKDADGTTLTSDAATVTILPENPQLQAGQSATAVISAAGGYAYFDFTPQYTESYTFYSVSDSDTYGYLYDEDMNEIDRDDDGGENANFAVTYTLTAGVTYIWGARYYNNSSIGSFEVALRVNHTAGEDAVLSRESCESEGTLTYTCTVCGQKVTEVIPAGHTIENGVCTFCGQKFCGDELTWTFDEATGTLTISGDGWMYWDVSWEVREDPASVPWWNLRSQIRSVVMEEGVRNIAINAFSNCSNLQSIQFPSTLMDIESNAFESCTSLTQVELPSDLYNIPTAAFKNCSGLTQIEIPDNVRTIGDSAFEGCSGLTQIELPNNLRYIETGAFKNCAKLTQIAIPDSVWNISSAAFSGCTGLTHVELPVSLSVIADEVFANCSSLLRITFSIQVNQIGASAFSGCTALKEITFTGDAPVIDSTAFTGVTAEAYYPAGSETWTDAVRIAYGGNLTWIADENAYCGDGLLWSFESETGTLRISGEGKMYWYDLDNMPWVQYQDQIQKIVIESGATSIGENAFRDCKNLSQADIPSTVMDIAYAAFGNCTSLTNVELPTNLETLNDCAFANCSSLKSITIPQSVTGIAYAAFSDCTSLASVELPEGLERINARAFSHCSSLTEIDIPDSVMDIAYSTFENCTSLASVKLPENLGSIDAWAFSNCSSLTSIDLPASLWLISVSAFDDCTGLQTIRFSGSAPLFESCFNGVTATAYYPASNETWTEDVLQDYGGSITWVSYGGETEVSSGDINGDDVVDINDAAELLWANLYSDGSSAQDLNNDGKKDENDVVYLLWHILFPDLFPL